ncbi:hypothetical protein IJD34_09170 [bacterium]|nr:hypothetical protein [bacterium]
MGLITQKIESTNLNTCNAKASCDAALHKKNNVGIVLGKNNNEIGDSFQNNAANVEQNEALEDKKNSKLKKGLIIGGAILATVAIAIGATYLIKQKRSAKPIEKLTELIDPQKTGVATTMPTLESLSKAGLSTDPPEFLYHLTNKKNYESMLKTKRLWQGYDKCSGRSVFTFELDNFHKNWNKILDSDVEMKARLLKQAAKRGDDVVLLQIPTNVLKKDKLFIRSQNAYFRCMEKSIYDYNDEKIAKIFTPENRKIVQEGKTTFEKLVSDFYKTLVTKNEAPLTAEHILGETPAGFASLLTTKGEPIEYLYREDIMMDSVKKIGEIKLSDYEGLSQTDLIKKTFSKLFKGVTTIFDNHN